ncbi:MAG: Replicative DNA helicase [bacterium]|nr:Replicative DNA helicase [bacterium]
MAEVIAARNLPFSLEAEKAVLAAMLHDGAALLAGLEVLRELDEMAKRESASRRGAKGKDSQPTVTLFHHSPHQILFDLISDLENRGRAPDFTTLIEEARAGGVLDRVGGASGILEIVSAAATGAGVRDYAEIVKEKYLKRRLIFSSQDVLERAYQDQADAETILDQAERELHAISDSRQSGSFVRIGDMLASVEENLLEAYRKKGMVTGVPTNFTELDKMTSGLQKTDLIILAARPSVGKTSLALNIVENIATKSKLPVGIFSLEMSAVQVIQRLICSMAKVDLKRLRTGHLSRRESAQVFQTLASLYPLPVYIDDTAGQTIAAVRAKALRLKHKEPNLALIVVDYLQLMEAGHARGGQRNRQEEVSAISRGLKGLARELGVPVLALSQLSRGVESREDQLPRLSDLRESGAIEQDADVVLFIHRKRPRKDSEEAEEDIAAEIIIGKQRNGPVGSVPVAFISRYASFNNLASFDAPEEIRSPEDVEEYLGPDVEDGVPF